MKKNIGRSWIATIGICCLAIAANFALQPLMHEKLPFAIFYPALVIIGIVGGIWPSLFALTAFLVATFHFWSPPFDDAIVVSFVIFSITGAVVCGVAAFTRTTMLRNRDSRIALQSFRERLDAAHVAAKMVEWHWDLQTGSMQLSNSARDILGAEWTQGGGGLQITHADDKSRVETTIAHGIKHDQGYSFTCRIIRPDTQEQRWIETRAVIHRNTLGEPTHVTGVTLDITDMKKALDALEISQRRFEIALKGNSIIAWSCDAERKYDWVYNPAQSLKAEEFIGKPLMSLFPRESYADYADALDRVWSSGIAETLPTTWTHLGQSRHYVTNIAPILDSTGKVAGMIGSSVDVTALHEAQQALREADKQKDEFIATLAHELRNPMAPIRYAAALITPDAHETALNNARVVIERQSQHMSRLLDDLLDMSRITRNVIELKLEEVDVRSLVQEAVDTAHPAIQAQKHSVVISAPIEPMSVKGDAVRLVQVIGNLLNNAIKYTPAGGRIDLVLSASDNHVVLAVRDTGVGLSPEMLPDVFRLFGQTHKSMQVSSGGLGIGLAVAKRLVELHGGTLEAHSDGLGFGSTFMVKLPKIISQSEPIKSKDNNVERLFSSNRRTLVVDDNKDAADILAAFLRMQGITVHVAYDGETALSIADTVRPNLIVLDLGLPDISGEDVAKELRKRDWNRALKIIAVTGWGQAADRQRTDEAGFDSHLVKPVDPKALIELLHTLSEEGDRIISNL